MLLLIGFSLLLLLTACDSGSGGNASKPTPTPTETLVPNDAPPPAVETQTPHPVVPEPFIPESLEGPSMTLAVYEGRAEYRTAPGEDWLLGFDAQPLRQGWSVRTFDHSTAVVHFSDGSRVWLGATAEVALEQFILSDGGPPRGQRHARVRLVNGEIGFDVAEAVSPPNTWSFVTNDGAVAIQGTKGTLKRRAELLQDAGAGTAALAVNFELELIEGSATLSRVGFDANGAEQVQIGSVESGGFLREDYVFCLDGLTAAFQPDPNDPWHGKVERTPFIISMKCPSSTDLSGVGGPGDDFATTLASIDAAGNIVLTTDTPGAGASLLTGVLAADLLSLADEDALPEAFTDIWGTVLVGGGRAGGRAYQKLDVSEPDPPDLHFVAARIQALTGLALGGKAAVAAANAGQGSFFVPGVDECVAVSFVPGDPLRPTVTGELWNGEGQPPDCMSSATKNANGLLEGDEARSPKAVVLQDSDDGTGHIFSSRQPRGAALEPASRGRTNILLAERPRNEPLYNADGKQVGVKLPDVVCSMRTAFPPIRRPAACWSSIRMAMRLRARSRTRSSPFNRPGSSCRSRSRAMAPWTRSSTGTPLVPQTRYRSPALRASSTYSTMRPHSLRSWRNKTSTRAPHISSASSRKATWT